MASSSSTPSSPSKERMPGAPAPPPKSQDIILKNALRYTISAKEYETLHKYIISRSKVLKRNAPSVAKVQRLQGEDGFGKEVKGGTERTGAPARRNYNSDDVDGNAAAVRASLRVFVATGAVLRLWGFVGEKVLGRQPLRGKRVPWYRNSNFRLSLSLSTILLLHRMLFRFFTRLRDHLLRPESRPFRKRNRRTSKTLTSSLAPAVGASLAGFALSIYPADQLRVTIAIYALSRAVEFAYNHAEEEGWIWGAKGSGWEKPWWWGSWLMFPVTCGQLLHAFVFDPDCFPTAYGNFILKNSPAYVHRKPDGYPRSLPWPSTQEMVGGLAEMGRLKYPPFISPILFPNSHTLPPSLTNIGPLSSSAHPLITSLTCATLHPTDPSCTRTYLTYWLRAFPRLARTFTLIFLVLSIPSYRSLISSPSRFSYRLASKILRYSTFVAGSIGTSWAAICFFQEWFPRSLLATQRFFLGGMAGGLWGYVVRGDAQAEFLYGARASVDSVWKVGRKRGWWRGVRGGDVGVFVLGLMVINVVYERDARAVSAGMVRRGISGLRGEGLGDIVKEEDARIKRLKEEGRL